MSRFALVLALLMALVSAGSFASAHEAEKERDWGGPPPICC
jgi:hypothetical protein